MHFLPEIVQLFFNFVPAKTAKFLEKPPFSPYMGPAAGLQEGGGDFRGVSPHFPKPQNFPKTRGGFSGGIFSQRVQ